MDLSAAPLKLALPKWNPYVVVSGLSSPVFVMILIPPLDADIAASLLQVLLYQNYNVQK